MQQLKSIELLSSLGMSKWKIPSGEINNVPYLRSIAAQGGEIILSSGMSTLGEVEFSIDVLESEGIRRSSITVLHCTSEYPAPLEDVNLNAMRTISNALNVATGYSDHTEGIVVPTCAAALGAHIIEKHLTLDRNLRGPDHKASIEPGEFKKMVEAIKMAKQVMGNGVKRPMKSERDNIKIVRKFIVASKFIKKGEVFNDSNLTTKRTGDGIPANLWDYWIGKKAMKDFEEDEIITG